MCECFWQLLVAFPLIVIYNLFLVSMRCFVSIKICIIIIVNIIIIIIDIEATVKLWELKIKVL